MSTAVSTPHIDFCVVGAIKAGTTSLFAWLANQDQVCGSTPKEPHYWCAPDGVLPYSGPGQQYWLEGGVTDTEKYESLFAYKQGLRGEASTGYLYDSEALERLHDACPHCKIIVMLREPVGRMHAAYRHAVRDGYEPTSSFHAALDAEAGRIEAGWGPLYYYRQASMYSGPLQACYRIFGRDAVLVAFFEDLISRPVEILETVARFLGITPNDWILPHTNEGLIMRRPVLRSTLTTAVDVIRPVARLLGIGRGKYWGNKAMQHINRATLWKPALTDEERSNLAVEFRDEIARVESVLCRSVPQSWHRKP
jgi:hypothetical protein